MAKLNRRDFLKTAAALGVAGIPGLLPLRVRAADAVAPSNRIAMGCIGVGGQGTGNLRAFLQNPEVQVVAVCDVDAAHREQARQIVEKYYAEKAPSGRYKGCAVYNDFRELLARPDIDAVTVCTPDHWHALITVAAAQAGKDIYCEKPLAHSVREGRAVVEAVRRHGRVLQTGSHERSGSNSRYAAELVRNGRIGRLHTIRVNLPIDNHGPIGNQPVMPVPPELDYNMWLGPAPWAPYTAKRCHFSFRYILDYSGGEMTDRGAHIIDLAQMGNGTDDLGPIEIVANGWAPPDGLFNVFMKYNFTCRYANGVELIGQSDGPRGLKFEGSDGWIFIHIHGGALDASRPSLLHEPIYPNEINLGRSPGHHQNFLDAVRTRGVPVAPAEVGHRTATICQLVNIALRTGEKIQWDPAREEITNSDRAARLLGPPMRDPWQI